MLNLHPASARNSSAWGPKAVYHQQRMPSTLKGLLRGFSQGGNRELSEGVETSQCLVQRETHGQQELEVEARYLRFLWTKAGLSHSTVARTIGKGCVDEFIPVRKNQDGRM